MKGVLILYPCVLGEDKGYAHRALLIYDGIHYDPLVLESDDGTVLQRLFPVSNDTVLLEALQIARIAHEVSQLYTRF